MLAALDQCFGGGDSAVSGMIQQQICKAVMNQCSQEPGFFYFVLFKTLADNLKNVSIRLIRTRSLTLCTCFQIRNYPG